MSVANGADANGAAAKRVRVCVRVRPTNVGVAASDRSSSHDDAAAANAVVIDEREQVALTLMRSVTCLIINQLTIALHHATRPSAS